ncbi:MAG: NusG domain II-containing protein [Clostridia bacterium]|nr:NusG domain II-containing protein [Clostridia bacterium]
MKNNSDKNRKIRNDIILAAAILVIAVAGLLFLNATKESGSYVVVKIDGVEKYSYSITDNVTQEIITGENGEHTNTLVIKDGKASVSTANCPDGICVGHREISFVGETIVCLPHKVVIEVQKETENQSLDAVV